MKKIAFPYLDDAPYMVYHSISIAIELAKRSDTKVHVLTLKKNYPLIIKILEQFNCKNIKIQILNLIPHIYIPHYIRSKIQIKKIIYRKHKKLLQSYDAFVFCKHDDIFLKKMLQNKKNIKYIFTNHGIANRKLSFHNVVSQYDLFFILGKREKEIREKMNQLSLNNYAIVGFLKYDVLRQVSEPSIFDNKNPTFIYNPHWQKGLTSFQKFADTVLSFFAKHSHYNLIFAPHSILVKRNFSAWFKIQKYKQYKNIRIDIESELSNNMSYTKYADVYIGDVSSQAMEFVFHKERPCIFLDAHALANHPEERPLSWDLGDIISNPNDFENAIKSVFQNHKNKYQQKQVDMKQEMFRLDNESASLLATKAIIKLLQ